jgi:endonuclease YncB( thermonuclease family)
MRYEIISSHSEEIIAQRLNMKYLFLRLNIMKIPRKRLLIPVFVVLLLVIRFVGQIDYDRFAEDRFMVTAVLDGDTIEISGGDKIRLLAIDCPEKGEPYYDSATVYLRNLVQDRTILVEYSHRRRDGYGRILAYIYLDSVFVNAAVLESGLGHIYLFDDNLADADKIASLLDAQNEAMTAGRGVWSIPHEPEEGYLAKKGSHRFHRPHCGAVKDADWGELIRFESREEAFRAGYSPCRNCRP